MRVLRNVFLVVAVLAVLVGCATGPVVSVSTPNTLSDLGTVGVVSVQFSPRQLPILPLVDAGLFNGAVADEEEVLGGIEAEFAPQITELVAERIEGANGAPARIVDVELPEVDWDEIDSAWAAGVATSNEVDTLIVPFVRTATTSVAAFGVNGATRLEMVLFVVDNSGEVVGLGEFQSPLLVSGPRDADAYRSIIGENYPLYTNQLMDAFLAPAE